MYCLLAQNNTIRLNGIYYADSLKEAYERVFVFYEDNSFVYIGNIPNNLYKETCTQWNQHFYINYYVSNYNFLYDKKDKSHWGKYKIQDSIITAKNRCRSQNGLGHNLVSSTIFKIVNDSTIAMIQGTCNTLECSYVVNENNQWEIGKTFPNPPIIYCFHKVEKPDSIFAWFRYTNKRPIKFK